MEKGGNIDYDPIPIAAGQDPGVFGSKASECLGQRIFR